MNNPAFVITTPGSTVSTDLLLRLEMIFIWWPFWRKQIVHEFWVGLIGLRTAFQSRLAYGASGSGDWWILHWASVYKTEEPLASTAGISPSHPARRANSQAYACTTVAASPSHWGLEKWDQWYLLDWLTSSIRLLIFVSSLQLGKVCPWRRYKSASQMNAA